MRLSADPTSSSCRIAVLDAGRVRARFKIGVTARYVVGVEVAACDTIATADY